MRISELSARSGVSVATIKYYLRERVLPEGERTSPTQATYGEPHLRRLGVIRALVDAGVGIAGVRNVISVLENPPESPGALLGAASTAVNPDTDDAHLDLEPACALVARFGGAADDCAPGQVAAVARALASLDRAGFAVPEPVLAAYVEHLAAIGEAELQATPADSAEEAVRYVVLGTVLVEPLILALRRIAEQTAASRRFGSG
ncbi:MAG: MerR family transcriptional regulator [Microbacterium sp. 71-36]|uniref:MerR family transcriptional regulator n=1 Tax=unclassified Microbacterium TaxID=2609290 RepID=UPI00086EE6D8|nr:MULTISPECIES: MerR family transcriptional regulator [unclassified Microbacterium]MBN9212102.1 MerR family transcriptional regulator [Microbacterium sp.]ODT40434.1 MAG: MerR family transcriptional regulator [Microbacterium sp. SCN 71-17]OJV77966.1 MAG: MerR family transcriptional regulator [Microbacterium sp. 71-36]